MASSSSVVPLSMEMEDDTPVLQVTVEDSIAMDKKKKKKPSAPPPPPASRLVDKAKKKLLGLPCSFFAVKFSCLLALFSAALLGASAGKSLKNTPCDPVSKSSLGRLSNLNLLIELALCVLIFIYTNTPN